MILSWFGKANTKKVSKSIKVAIVAISIIGGLLLVFAGRLLLAAPILLVLLPLIKLKSGISLFKILMMFRLLNTLRQQGRFSYKSGTKFSAGTNTISLSEAYDVLDCKQGDSKERVMRNYKKLMRKLHPDLNKDINSTKISQILTEAKDLIIKTDFS